jgi:hypothetical protein
MKTFIKNLSFTKRNIPIPADYRPLYKIGHIVLILFLSCRSSKATLMKLHFLCWTLKTKMNMTTVQGWIKNNFNSELHIWGIEPTVNRALKFAIADGLIEDHVGEFVLTERGVVLAKAIIKDKELFMLEKVFLQSIGKNIITEQRIKDLSQKFI